MTEALWQITAPHFCAGIVAIDDHVREAAPILRWAIGWRIDRLLGYCKNKGWNMAEHKPTGPAKDCVPCGGKGTALGTGARCVACAGSGVSTKSKMEYRSRLADRLLCEALKLDDADLEHLIRIVEGMAAF